MKQNFHKSIFMLLICLVGMLCSCSKETYSEDDEATKNVAVWDNSQYTVSYIQAIPGYGGSMYDDYFDIKISLDDSENPSRYIDFHLENYTYGEKLDLTTNKYLSYIHVVDESIKDKVSFYFHGGDNAIKSGSYFVMNRTNDKVSVDLYLSYVNNNGFPHSIKINYDGILINPSSLPSSDYQEVKKENYTYKFVHNGNNYLFGDARALFEDNYGGFEAYLHNETSPYYFATSEFEYGKQCPISEISFIENNVVYRFKKDMISEGSYMKVLENANKFNDCDVIIYAKCEGVDGKVHEFDIEYKGFLHKIE